MRRAANFRLSGMLLRRILLLRYVTATAVAMNDCPMLVRCVLRILLIVLGALVLMVPAFSQVGNKKFFRHRGQTIELGDSRYEVMSRIGQPNGKIKRKREFVRKVDRQFHDSTWVKEEKWLYNFGSRRFIAILTFENQELTRIESGEYGFDAPDMGNCHTVSMRANIGDIIPVVLMKCGNPSFQEDDSYEKYIPIDEYRGERVRVRTEEWTYNFGPGQPMTVLHFENGYLTEVEQGPRGF